MAKSPISILQEYTQIRRLCLPQYRVVEIIGQIPNETFKCEVRVADRAFVGEGRTKRDAKTNCAQNALSFFDISMTNAENASLCLQPQKKAQDNIPWINYVGKLNEFASTKKFPPPIYQDGLPTGNRFCVRCSFADYQTEGFGYVKKDAKQEAAKQMMNLVVENKLGPCELPIKRLENNNFINHDNVILKYWELKSSYVAKFESCVETEDVVRCQVAITDYDQLTKEITKRGWKYELELFQSDPFIYSMEINKGFVLGCGDTKKSAMADLVSKTAQMLSDGFNFSPFIFG